MASSNARGTSPEDSQLGDAIYRMAVILFVRRTYSSRVIRNNALTILTSEYFQNWLVKKHDLRVESKTPRLISQEYEALIGVIALESGFEVAVKHVLEHLSILLDTQVIDTERLLEFLSDINGDILEGPWHYVFSREEKLWVATKDSKLAGLGKTKSLARWNALMGYYFP